MLTDFIKTPKELYQPWASDAWPSLDELEQIHAPQSLLLLLHAVQTSVFGTPAGGAAAALDSSAFMVASRGTSSGNGASRLLESRVSACASAWVCGSGWTCDSTRLSTQEDVNNGSKIQSSQLQRHSAVEIVLGCSDILIGTTCFFK